MGGDICFSFQMYSKKNPVNINKNKQEKTKYNLNPLKKITKYDNM